MATVRQSLQVTHRDLSIHAVTFDVGGTLIECFPSVGHIYSGIAARNGCPRIAPALLNRRFAAAWRKLIDFRHTRAQWAALVDSTFGNFVGTPPSQSFFPALYEKFGEADAWRVFQDVLPTLKALKGRGLKLGVISNWDERLRPLLQKLSLDQFFDSITVSCDIGAPKPARTIFLEAARQLGVTPAEVLHVGDTLEADVRGARAAGFQSVLLKRGSKSSRPGTIQSLIALASEPLIDAKKR